MRALAARLVRQALSSKGFVLHQGASRDHDMFFLVVEGKKSSFFVKLSRGARDMRMDEMSNSARQLRVAPSSLFKVLSCEFDAQATRRLYEESLRSG
jgi:hypothetical protein